MTLKATLTIAAITGTLLINPTHLRIAVAEENEAATETAPQTQEEAQDENHDADHKNCQCDHKKHAKKNHGAKKNHKDCDCDHTMASKDHKQCSCEMKRKAKKS